MAQDIAHAERRASSSRPPEAPPPNDQLPLGYETAAWLFNPGPDFPAGAYEPESHARVPERQARVSERHGPLPEQHAPAADSKGASSGTGEPGGPEEDAKSSVSSSAGRIAKLQHVDASAKIRESLKNDELFRQRKRDNRVLMADEQRVKTDLKTAKLDRARLNQMLHGDPAHGGERLPLGFKDYGEFHEFKADLAAIIANTRVDGEPITASARQIGTATSFYSGNPKKPLGHHFDRRAAEGKLGDVDIQLNSPALAKAMTRVPGVKANPKVIIGGEMTIFKSSGPGGFGEAFPQFEEFMSRWSRRLGREVDIKLRLDLTPVESLPKFRRGPGPIEIL